MTSTNAVTRASDDLCKRSNEFDSVINLKKFKEHDGTINNIRDLSPIDFAFAASTKIIYKDKVYEANIYPNSRIELIARLTHQVQR